MESRRRGALAGRDRTIELGPVVDRDGYVDVHAGVDADGTPLEVRVPTAIDDDVDIENGVRTVAEQWAVAGRAPGVRPLADWGTDPVPWFATERVPKAGSSDLLRACPLETRLDVVTTLAETVANAIDRGADAPSLRSSALSLRRDGNRIRPAIDEWGIETILSTPGDERHVPPEWREQDGTGDADERALVYRLGALASALLLEDHEPGPGPRDDSEGDTGRRSPESGDPSRDPLADPGAGILDDPSVGALDGPSVATTLKRATASAPADRHESVRRFRADLDALEPVSTPDVGDGTPWPSLARRRIDRLLDGTTSAGPFRRGVCDIVSTAVGDAVVWIGDLATDPGTLRVHAAAGGKGAPTSISVGERVTSDGPVARCTATGEVVIETGHDPELDRVREAFEGVPDPVRSSVAVPIVGSGRRYGVLRIHAAEERPVAGHEDALAELGSTVGRGLRSIELAAQRRRASDRLERIRSTISHDLQSPLNVAQGRLEAAMAECDSDDLEHVEYGLDRLTELTDRTLEVVRAGRPPETRVFVSVRGRARAVWGTLARSGASLEVVDDPCVRAEPDRLSRLLEELFRNALEHADGDVSVTVGALATDHGFFVADTGPGISPDDRPHVFDWGYRVGSDGAGIGLTIVESIATAHGWDVRVTDGDGGGARIELITSDAIYP